MNFTTLLQFALGIFIHILPVLLWGVFYIKRDKERPEPKLLLLFAFVVGGLTTLPLFLLRLFLEYFPGFTWEVLFGQASLSILIAVFLSALMEEMLKHTGALFVMRKDLAARNELSDGIIYGVASALGFAFVENIFYTWSFYDLYGLTPELLELFVWRNLLTMYAHTVFSGIFGYFYARAFVVPNLKVINRSTRHITIFEMIKRVRLRHLVFTVTRAHLTLLRVPTLPGWKGANAMELLIEGAWAACIMHGVYNALFYLRFFDYSLAFLVPPLLFLETWLLFWLLKRKK